LRTIISFVCASVILAGLTGCQQISERELLVLEFEQNKILRYELISERTVNINLGDTSKSKKQKPHSTKEKLELIIAYKPIRINPYGLTTISATCESAKVQRSSSLRKRSGSGSDAIESLKGKTFTFQVSPVGKIEDYANLQELVRQLGEKAFATKTGNRGKIKNPDMIFDFVALQWYLWDSVATIGRPLEGVKAGQTWKTNQLIPLPIPLNTARETTYLLDDITEEGSVRKAVIKSSFKSSDVKVANWPRPYTGPFNIKGIFGFLRNYKVKSIDGSGEQLFNIDRGVIENETQQYDVKIEATFLLPLGDSRPSLSINQKISLRLLNEK